MKRYLLHVLRDDDKQLELLYEPFDENVHWELLIMLKAIRLFWILIVRISIYDLKDQMAIRVVAVPRSQPPKCPIRLLLLIHVFLLIPLAIFLSALKLARGIYLRAIHALKGVHRQVS